MSSLLPLPLLASWKSGHDTKFGQKYRNSPSRNGLSVSFLGVDRVDKHCYHLVSNSKLSPRCGQYHGHRKTRLFSVVCLGTVNAKLQIQWKKETFGYSHPSNDDKCAGFAFADDLKELDSLNTMH